MTSTLPELHTSYVDRLRDLIARDERFEALLAGGSLVHGGFDEQSDLDFVLVVADHAWPNILAERRAIAERLGPLLSAFTGEHVGEPRLLICLYGPPLIHIDLKFVTADDLDVRIERPAIVFARAREAVEQRLAAARIAWPDRSSDWFEARAWVWLHYAATKLLRGEIFEVLGMLAFFREQVLGPMLARRAGRPQRGVRRLETSALDQDGKLAATVCGHDSGDARAALLAAMALYLELRAEAPPSRLTPAMPEALLDLLGMNGSTR